MLLINGMGGIGKSAIARYYLTDKKDTFSYYGFFNGFDSFVSELRVSLGLKQKKFDNAFLEALSKLRNLPGTKLLVIDDVKDIEKQQKYVNMILGLKDNGYKILFTSREEIKEIQAYELKILIEDDAKKLFNSIYEVENELLLEEILSYLDYHAYFIKLTAEALRNKVSLTPAKLLQKFNNGEFSKVSLKRKDSFERYLDELFTFNTLDEEEILVLKQMAILPSVEIDFDLLSYFLMRSGDKEGFEDVLTYLVEKGLLTLESSGYKLHQITKEYIFNRHIPNWEDIQAIILFFQSIIGSGRSPKNAINIQEFLNYFASITKSIELMKIKNVEISFFLSALGNVYRLLGMYKNAEDILFKTLEMRKELLGDNHIDTASSCSNLAGLYVYIGNFKEAEPLYFQAVKIYIKKVGEEHHLTATCKNNIANFYESINKNKKAEAFCFEALKLREKLLGKSHIDTITSYHNIAKVYLKNNKQSKALTYFKKALSGTKITLGEKHPDTIMSHADLAEFYSQTGKTKQAKPLFLYALKNGEDILGKNHPSLAVIYYNIGTFYFKKKQYMIAYEYLQKAIGIWEKVLPKGHKILANAYISLKNIRVLCNN